MASHEITEAVAELTSAGVELEAARNKTSEARSLECNAVNRVNRAQKRVDVLLAEMKKTAPRETDWTARPGVMVEKP